MRQITKNLKTLTIGALLISALFTLTSCNDSSSYKTTQETIPLVVGEEVVVYSGDKVNPATEATEVEVRHLLDANKKYVTLISGSADLIRGNYAITE